VSIKRKKPITADLVKFLASFRQTQTTEKVEE